MNCSEKSLSDSSMPEIERRSKCDASRDSYSSWVGSSNCSCGSLHSVCKARDSAKMIICNCVLRLAALRRRKQILPNFQVIDFSLGCRSMIHIIIL